MKIKSSDNTIQETISLSNKRLKEKYPNQIANLAQITIKKLAIVAPPLIAISIFASILPANAAPLYPYSSNENSIINSLWRAWLFVFGQQPIEQPTLISAIMKENFSM
ncbi:MAG: hypothetical protein ACRDAI_07610 [Candidatus Rhabdochlamydia sp.]